MTWTQFAFFASLFAIPLLVVAIDSGAQFISRIEKKTTYRIDPTLAPYHDYTIIVPIYGKIEYFENVEFLAPYRDKVLVVTSAGETPEFDHALDEIANRHGFRVYRSPLDAPTDEGKSERQTGGVLRDTIVRNCHAVITSEYVVCIDADTESIHSLDMLVAVAAHNDLDAASVRLTAANQNSILTKIQGHEYDMAMRMRRLMPWMISGGCHVFRTATHRDLMHRHTLFFQGNDIELGLLAAANDYKVGHILFDVPTKVPDTLRAWFRQRKAWSGGEFRIAVLNPHVVFRHPWLYFYSFFVVLTLTPVRWYFMMDPSRILPFMIAVYMVVIFAINWHRRHWTLLLYPVYSFVSSMFIVPIGVANYVRVAAKHRNTGIMTPKRHRSVIDLRDHEMLPTSATHAEPVHSTAFAPTVIHNTSSKHVERRLNHRTHPVTFTVHPRRPVHK